MLRPYITGKGQILRYSTFDSFAFCVLPFAFAFIRENPSNPCRPCSMLSAYSFKSKIADHESQIKNPLLPIPAFLICFFH